MATTRTRIQGEKATKISGYVQKEKLDVWTNVKRELEKRNGQKLNDSFILNFILGNIQREGKLVIFL
ncbi:MAG: hypothetical protein IPL26_00135 [Leptospiraceae bacterium]|nr:hypothetical protein [Leptospiraceae bacterium]